MAEFCSMCGAQLKDGAGFCRSCGAPADGPAPMNAAAGYAGNGADRTGVPAPGFSDRADHPEILAKMKKNRIGAFIFGIIIIPLPFAGFMIYSSVSGKMETKNAAVYGGIVSGVFLLFALISLLRRTAAKPYDAVVIGKRTRQVERSDSSDSSSYRSTYTEYITTVQTSTGKKKKIRERDGSLIYAYSYLQPGDRFRYHPQFHFPYELYDKSKAPYIRCVSCTKENPVTADRCSKCGIPLLK
ncbi:MAG: zinc ribbon domain-containing protein [Ruminococcus sp.]|nr:zinc ribbon domain-containing protein [Ruminococcus sp.]